MKILHINTADKLGGAAIAAFRLHSAMAQKHESKMLVMNKITTGKNIISGIQSKGAVARKIFTKIIVGGKAFLNWRFNKNYDHSKGLFSYQQFGIDISDNEALREADIIYLHWICGGFLTIGTIAKILRLEKPVFWVLHDMWAMTGGCHYSFECEKYMTHCADCPHLLKPGKHDYSWKLFEKKKKVFDRAKNLSIITPSKWLADCAKKSKLLGDKPISVIPNTLDTSVFKPHDKHFAREVFNLPKDKKIVLFGADSGTKNPYKGWEFLEAALKKLSSNRTDIEAFIFGSEYDERIAKAVPFKVHFSGRLHDEVSLSLLYNAADAFIVPSLADNFPNTVAESLSCGTPVVAFDVGGIPDMVAHKQNGYLAKYKDSDDLADGILYVLDNDLAGNGIAKITEMCGGENVVSAHEKLWR